MNWFDPEDRSAPVITAKKQMRGGHRGYTVDLPETAVVFFMGYGMEVAAEYPSHILTEKFPRFLRACPIGQFDTGNRACFINGGSAAPMAADTLECLAASGVKRVLVMGMCGAIAPDINVGDVLLPSRALVVEVAALLVASDKHPEQEGDTPWGWHITREMREKFLRRGIEFALTL